MLNGLKPYHYLTYVMEKMKDLGPFPEKEALQELLPWSASLPAVYYGENVPLFRRNGYRKSGTMILRVRSRDTALK